MACFGTLKLQSLKRRVFIALALLTSGAGAADFGNALDAVMRRESTTAAATETQAQNKDYETLDRVAVAYLQAMVAQDNFKAAHAQIHAVVMQRNFIRRNFLNGEDVYTELVKSRARIGTLLAQWIEAREQVQLQRKILSNLTGGAVSDVAGTAFAYIPPPLAANSPESKLSQQGMQLTAPTESENIAIDLEVLRLYQAVQVGNSQLDAYKSALHWSLETLDSTAKAQDASNQPHPDMLEAMGRVLQSQNDIAKARYDNLYQRIRLCAKGGMAPEAIAAHIDALVRGDE